MATKFPEMQWDASDLAEEFKIFRQRIELCLADQDITDQAKQAVKIKIAVGKEGLRKINASSLTEDEQRDPSKLWDLFEKQLKVKLNFRIHRLELMRYRQKPKEHLDEFVNRCRAKAVECQFTVEELTERVVELVIASTPSESFQKDLLDRPIGYSIDEMLIEGRKYEAIVAGKQSLQSMETGGASVNAIWSKSRACRNCGLSHPPRRCPAYHDTCKACGAKGHWSKCCRKTRARSRQRRGSKSPRRRRSPSGERRRSPSRDRRPQQRKPKGRKKDESSTPNTTEQETDVHQLEYTDNAYEEVFHVVTVPDFHKKNDNTGNEAYRMLDVVCPDLEGKHRLKVKIDTGAGGNTLPLRTIRQMYGDTWRSQVKPVTTKLTAYNGTPIPCLGSIDLLCRYQDPTWSENRFYVVDVTGPVIAGLPMCRDMGVVTIHAARLTSVQSIEQLMEAYPDQFDTIGSFKRRATLYLKEDAVPHIDPPRKYSVHLKPKLKVEIDKMEALGVIRRVAHHTDWCSSITTSLKQDGSIRVCLDPKRLNQSLRRCPHKIPTLEELNPEFSQARVFSKLDAKAGYWAVHLDEKSQELTTFRTPFGRYCFQRLPFGLAISQDIFQQCMDEIVDQVPGCVCIADDIVVYGRTDEEHDANLRNLFEVAGREGLVFNSTKCRIKTKKISFFGSIYSDVGVQPDPGRVEDIHNLPTPQDKEDLQKFLGLITYVSAYIPNLADKAAILRDLLKKNIPFVWQEDHQAAFEALKLSITADACLQYYNPEMPTVLEVDASQKGLGACLTQHGKPIAFASKSLSPAQKNYSNIERETLALVFGIARFHNYLFGKEFVVYSDHKPLEMIWRKPLSSAPPRLQRLLIKVQGYNFTVHYKPGPTMILSDALSRLPNPKKNEDIHLDRLVGGIDVIEGPELKHIDLLHFGQTKQTQLQVQTARDPTLSSLTQVIYAGWPDEIKELPRDLRPYWPYRDELGISWGVIFKGKQIVIPDDLRQDILAQLHTGHMGIEKTRRLARETVYWPNISRDIDIAVRACEYCQENQPKQKKEPLHPHEIPSTPWTKIGTDLFEIGGDDFLLIIDYTSKFPVVHRLRDTKSATVAGVTSRTLGMFGAPAEIISDNGPQFVGAPYQDMCASWGISHITSSPRYPQSNGFVERAVRTVKTLIKRCQKSKQNVDKALLNLRATPIDSKLPSPAEILFGRPPCTSLPSRRPYTEARHEEMKDAHDKRRDRMKADYDRRYSANELPPLHVGQKVRILDQDSRAWLPGEVTTVCREPRSYKVATPNGSILRRTRSHLREMTDSRHSITPKRVRFADTEKTKDLSKQHKLPNHSNNAARATGDTPQTTRSGRVIRRPVRYIQQ
ncbi:uncharacterized protein K02A2.6-like [Patiria miniata]|uniref:Reverse transcriptase n=1 Tax=Patiria miniata TaxID=46514 RepID=A0A913Z4N3_PATMI|nr:uncharacterized protein K02A2.6-like [Patiria miniata]